MGLEPTQKVATRELDGAVEIRVRDNGIGIPSEIKDSAVPSILHH